MSCFDAWWQLGLLMAFIDCEFSGSGLMLLCYLFPAGLDLFLFWIWSCYDDNPVYWWHLQNAWWYFGSHVEPERLPEQVHLVTFVLWNCLWLTCEKFTGAFPELFCLCFSQNFDICFTLRFYVCSFFNFLYHQWHVLMVLMVQLHFK